jgi:outer membrane protein
MFKKFIILALFLLTSLFAQNNKDNFYVGLGEYVQTQPYTNTDAVSVPFPTFFYDNHIVYIRLTRLGVYFMGSSSDEFSWGASFTAQPRPFGYKSEDSSTLTTMNERKTSWEAGLAISMQTKHIFFEGMILNDVLNNCNGYMARAELGLDYKIDEWSFYPSILAIYHSKEINNYYYGVQNSEAIQGRNAYTSEAGTDFGAQVYIKYNFIPHWHALLNLRADKLSNEITNSPIVSDDFMYSGIVSLLYSFEL